jgi:triosephosphate isomerase
VRGVDIFTYRGEYDKGYEDLREQMEPIFIANWKMNLFEKEALAFVRDLAVPKTGSVIIAPPATLLFPLKQAIKGKSLALCGQNFFFEEKGAYTGELSASQLKDSGASYALIGHSERRHYFNESDAWIHQKLKSALAHHLIPILCVGETLDEKEEGKEEEVLSKQLHTALEGSDEKALSSLVIAYEPVWAIGTGLAADLFLIERGHAFIRKWLEKHYPAIATKIPILYGGSVNEKNAASFLSLQEVAGLLVGGASLAAPPFNAIIRS